MSVAFVMLSEFLLVILCRFVGRSALATLIWLLRLAAVCTFFMQLLYVSIVFYSMWVKLSSRWFTRILGALLYEPFVYCVYGLLLARCFMVACFCSVGFTVTLFRSWTRCRIGSLLHFGFVVVVLYAVYYMVCCAGIWLLAAGHFACFRGLRLGRHYYDLCCFSFGATYYFRLIDVEVCIYIETYFDWLTSLFDIAVPGCCTCLRFGLLLIWRISLVVVQTLLRRRFHFWWLLVGENCVGGSVGRIVANFVNVAIATDVCADSIVILVSCLDSCVVLLVWLALGRGYSLDLGAAPRGWAKCCCLTTRGIVWAFIGGLVGRFMESVVFVLLLVEAMFLSDTLLDDQAGVWLVLHCGFLVYAAFYLSRYACVFLFSLYLTYELI
eukprot:gene2879-1861_t